MDWSLARCRRRIPIHLSHLVLFLTVSAVWAPDLFARAGGGRSGGGGILGLILMPFLIIYAWYVNRRINQKQLQVTVLLKQLAAKDPRWAEDKLHALVRLTFVECQSAWSEQDIAKLENLIHPDLLAEWKAEIDLLKSNQRRNIMENVVVNAVRIVEVENYKGDDQDSFVACIDAGAIDYTVDASGHVVESNVRNKSDSAAGKKEFQTFREFWTFRWYKKGWRPSEVDQSGQWKKSVDAPLVNENE